MAEAASSSGLLNSVGAVFELNRKENEKRIQKLKNQREAELVHSKYLKNNASPGVLQEAKFVVNKWSTTNISRRMEAVNRSAEKKRHNQATASQSSSYTSDSSISPPGKRKSQCLFDSSDEEIERINNLKINVSKKTRAKRSVMLDVRKEPALKKKRVRSPIDPLPRSINTSVIEISDDSLLTISDQENQDNIQGATALQSSSSGSQSVVRCPVLNCNFQSSSKTMFDLHMELYEHSSNIPWHEMPDSKEMLKIEETFCPECGKIFKTFTDCKRHMSDVKHSTPNDPIRIGGYLCQNCLKLFSREDECCSHIKSLKHFNVAFPFKEDIDKKYQKGIPVSHNFVEDYYAKCIDVDIQLVCCDCDMIIEGPQQLKQHLDETNLTHHCSVLSSTEQTEIFASYFCTNKCASCHSVVNESKGFHKWDKKICGKILVDGLASFRELVIGHCVKLEIGNKSNLQAKRRLGKNPHKASDVVDKDIKSTKCADEVDKKQIPLTETKCESKGMLSNATDNNCDVNSLAGLGVTQKSDKNSDVNLASSSGVTQKSSITNKYDPFMTYRDKPQASNNRNSWPPKRPRRSKISDVVNRLNALEFKPLEDPEPSFLKEMNNIIFLDVDNWPKFFHKLPQSLPLKTFVWGFYGGKTVWYPPKDVQAFRDQQSTGMFYLNDRCGTTKDAADFAITLTVGKMDMCLPSWVNFTILSGDKGFCELERQMDKTSKRKLVVIDPHQATKFSDHALYTMIVSVTHT